MEGVGSTFSAPAHPGEFILVREIVMCAAAKCFFKSITQALGQMFGRRGYGKLVAISMLPFHNASQRIANQIALTFFSNLILGNACARELIA